MTTMMMMAMTKIQWSQCLSSKGDDSDDTGRNEDYGGIDTDDDGGNDTDDDGGIDTDDDGGIDTDDDDDGDNPDPPLGSNREPGLQERAALHGRRMANASRPHTHRSLSRLSPSLDTATVGSQPHSIAVDKQHGLSSTSDDRVSSHIGQVMTDCQDSLVHTDHSLSHIECKSKTLRGGETDPSPTPHLTVRCQSDGVSTYPVAAFLGPVSSICFCPNF
ncbi:hypothetical protein ElyMa_004992600 [Elysia marginata]|uniref:Uncharacterized protein n=1 Tax=Elysia marginata TaxID=1093978 RepID=A0AAV4J657_9GAST|nr:hypothetical protein ElyMa_004992600 [Elysia marginata]